MLPLDPRVEELQEAYIRQVVDTVHDLPNVLYEVANESSGETADTVKIFGAPEIPTPIGDSTQWQYWVIGFLKKYERQRGYASHPIGMTFQYPVPDQSKANEPLWNSPADWISPGFDDDPPANDGTKVVISDTDHYSPFKADALWAWKQFLRGHNPILYDLGIIHVGNLEKQTPGAPPHESYEPARLAMGDTLQLAKRVDLASMTPNGQLSSTGYLLGHPEREYLVLDPRDSNDPFTVTVEPGTYAVEWFGVQTRTSVSAGEMTVERLAATAFEAPPTLTGPTVLYLRHQTPAVRT